MSQTKQTNIYFKFKKTREQKYFFIYIIILYFTKFSKYSIILTEP